MHLELLDALQYIADRRTKRQDSCTMLKGVFQREGAARTWFHWNTLQFIQRGQRDSDMNKDAVRPRFCIQIYQNFCAGVPLAYLGGVFANQTRDLPQCVSQGEEERGESRQGLWQ